jgi:hypothetical protein
MAQSNVKVGGSMGDEAEIRITETKDGLSVEIPKHLDVGGIETKNGNLTIATTHGNVMLPSGLNFSLNLWQRGGSSKPKRNVTIK